MIPVPETTGEAFWLAVGLLLGIGLTVAEILGRWWWARIRFRLGWGPRP